jgi:CBS domain-containing protein
MKQAKDIMSGSVVTVEESSSLERVLAILDDKGFSGLPVTNDEKKLVGLISRTDITTYVLANKADQKIKISELMTPFVFNFDPDDSLKKIVDTMVQARIHRIVVTDDGEPVGIITAMDLMAEFANTLRG